MAGRRARGGAVGAIRSIAHDRSQSSKDLGNKVQGHFNKFLKDVYSPANVSYTGKTLVTLEAGDFSPDLFECFAGYLEDHPDVNKLSTARVYFSGALLFVERKFPKHHEEVLKKKAGGWQELIRKHFNAACRAARAAPVDHHIPMCEGSNVVICARLFSMGKYEEGLLQVLDWANGGRINEGVDLLWSDLKLREETTAKFDRCCVSVDWYRSKTAVLTSTFLFVHKDRWEACCMHSLARAVVLSPRACDRIFPSLQSTSVVSRMNQLFKTIYLEWKAQDDVARVRRELDMARGIFPLEPAFTMPANLTTHGNRAGCITLCRSRGIDDATLHKHCGMCSSRDSNLDSYDAVSFDSDAKVSNIA
jgi:hypothetical protein